MDEVRKNIRGKFALAIISIVLFWIVSIGIAFGVTAGNNSSGSVPPSAINPSQTPNEVLNGQQVFSANCTSCHNTEAFHISMSQVQLQNFVTTHNTGKELSQAAITAIVLFLKP